MNIGIVGLGLIGGSLARTIKAKTNYTVGGYDISPEVVDAALKDKSIDFSAADFSSFDLILVSLFPKDTVKFLKDNVDSFKENTLIIDCCGIKEYVCNEAELLFADSSSLFLGGHPMAGREAVGYFSSTDSLFSNASMILTPSPDFPQESLNFAEKFFLSLGFRNTTVTTPKHHDMVIAYTSQLAHVVSSAYMQSPMASEFMGFSAGSFADLTRVAKLNPYMWSELFLMNSSALVNEIDILIGSLTEYRDLIKNNDETKLIDILQKGTDIKENLTKQRNGGNQS